MRYVALPLIWFLLLLVNVAGFIIGLPALLIAPSYGARIFRMHNRAASSVLGFSGEHAISYECGRSKCRLCAWLCKVLSFVLRDQDHCKKAT